MSLVASWVVADGGSRVEVGLGQRRGIDLSSLNSSQNLSFPRHTHTSKRRFIKAIPRMTIQNDDSNSSVRDSGIHTRLGF
ncbi:hypothetical protein L6452_13543 [Arctium lappa]|uniref:Uncharacterized protein n=1 Tax=Arctium lappa TaxID=4217 RepID=A0ACB9CIW9_ARCLA|nr:hypothetical protein L6452_13543 [Arctium lappa]